MDRDVQSAGAESVLRSRNFASQICIRFFASVVALLSIYLLLVCVSWARG